MVIYNTRIQYTARSSLIRSVQPTSRKILYWQGRSSGIIYRDSEAQKYCSFFQNLEFQFKIKFGRNFPQQNLFVRIIDERIKDKRFGSARNEIISINSISYDNFYGYGENLHPHRMIFRLQTMWGWRSSIMKRLW